MKATTDLKVFITRRESTCDEYGEDPGRKAWITLGGDKAEHACQRYSGRVGRSAAAKAQDEQAIRLAVTAYVRHAETEYDSLLAVGIERREARAQVSGEIDTVLARWESGEN